MRACDATRIDDDSVGANSGSACLAGRGVGILGVCAGAAGAGAGVSYGARRIDGVI